MESKSDKKKRLFDEQFKAFVDQATETINAKYGKMIEMGEKNNDLLFLKNYYMIYDTMKDPAEHFQYFENIYNANRINILGCLNNMDWMLNSDIYIQFGSGKQFSKAAEEKRKTFRINLSSIFSIADELRLEANKVYQNVDEKYITGEGAKDLIRFDILLLHLMRIFYYLNDSNDKHALLKIVNQLEENVGTSIRTKEDIELQPNNPISGAMSGEAARGGIGQLIGLATGVMKKMGYEPPANMVIPNDDQVFGAIEAIVGNPQTQTAIHGMMSSLNGCTDVGEAIRTVVGGITDPTTMSALQGTLQQTAQAAVSNNTVQTSVSNNSSQVSPSSSQNK